MHSAPVVRSLDAFRRSERFQDFEEARTRNARVLVVRHNTCLMSTATGAPLLLPASAECAPAAPVFLGLDAAGNALYVLEIERDATDEEVLKRFGVADDQARFADPMTQLGRLSNAERETLLTALALIRWSSEHRYCNACGTVLRWNREAWTKSCSRAERPHRVFPRLDPATIMLVHDGDRVLLGRQKQWPSGAYSTLAGFVAPGESVEDAVVREVYEESGVAVGDVRYFGSEAWPFPRSLMLGFFARARDFDIRVGEELEDARWFSRAELRALYERTSTRMPYFDTIARRLMLAWLEPKTSAG